MPLRVAWLVAGTLLVGALGPANVSGEEQQAVPLAPAEAAWRQLAAEAAFVMAALRYKRGEIEAEKVKVYQYIEGKSWQPCGYYDLLDAWREERDEQKVYVFQLKKQKETLNA